jgi:hypothetical protein
MDQNLVGYLLKSLDPDDQHAVEDYLRTHPEGQARLEVLRQRLAPLAADDDDPLPPRDLVDRTLARVAEHCCLRLPSAPKNESVRWPGPNRRRFRRADLLVAAALLILVGGVATPWLARSWHGYQVRSCQQNLASFWNGLLVYSDTNDGRFPQVQRGTGPLSFAGSFVPVLHDAGVLPDTVNVNCPAVERQAPAPVSVVELEAAYGTRPAEFEAQMRRLAPGYAYSLGYEENNALHGLHRGLGDLLPLMADRPDDAGADNSPNHGGGGQNVLYIGGHVRWCTERNVGEGRDDIYLNRRRQLRAGLGRSDTVLGPSYSCPYPGRSE